MLSTLKRLKRGEVEEKPKTGEGGGSKELRLAVETDRSSFYSVSPSSYLILKTKRNDLTRPVMGTIFLVVDILMYLY